MLAATNLRAECPHCLSEASSWDDGVAWARHQRSKAPGIPSKLAMMKVPNASKTRKVHVCMYSYVFGRGVCVYIYTNLRMGIIYWCGEIYIFIYI